MPLPLPNLDDLTYTDLVESARAYIPSLYPAWTNHNPIDPGIVLIELLAWLTESVIFRADQVTDNNTLMFLKLLNGPNWTYTPDPSDPTPLETATHAAILNLRERYRAATREDFEYLIKVRWPQEQPDQAEQLGRVKRAHCLPRRNLDTTPVAWDTLAPGHITLVVIPDAGPEATTPQPTPELCKALWTYLDERRLLTTRHHIVGPSYVAAQVAGVLFLQADALAEPVLRQAAQALRAYFHPLTGGPQGQGWPFGRDVYVSEVFALLNNISLVDHVEGVMLTSSEAARAQREGNAGVGITLQPHELVAIEIKELIAVETNGNQYKLDGADQLYQEVRDAWQLISTPSR